MATDKETTRFSISMPKEDAKRIREEADRQHISRSGLIRNIDLPEIERRKEERREKTPA